MNHKRKLSAAIVSILFSAQALATPPKPPPTPLGPSMEQEQGQAQKQQQQQLQLTKVNLEVDAGSESIATATNEGVEQSVAFTYPRQAPSLAQGSMYLVGCGMSLNGGGSQTGGAAFLGFQFITPYCRDQAQIAREAALGNVKTACEMDRLTPSGKRNLKRMAAAGLTVEPCPVALAVPAPAPEVKPVVVEVHNEGCANQLNEKQVDEKIARAFEECVSK